MKNIFIATLLVLLLVGCGTYKIQKGQPFAELIFEAPNLRKLSAFPDDVAIVQMFENETNFGFYRLEVESNKGVFKIPANKITSLNAYQNMAFFGGLASCKFPIKVTPKENEKYKLIINYSEKRKTCTANFYKHDGSKYIAQIKLKAIYSSQRFSASVIIR